MDFIFSRSSGRKQNISSTTLEVKSLSAEDHARELGQGMALRIHWSPLLLSPSIYKRLLTIVNLLYNRIGLIELFGISSLELFDVVYLR